MNFTISQGCIEPLEALQSGGHEVASFTLVEDEKLLNSFSISLHVNCFTRTFSYFIFLQMPCRFLLA